MDLYSTSDYRDRHGGLVCFEFKRFMEVGTRSNSVGQRDDSVG
jgi:hypothetical protein